MVLALTVPCPHFAQSRGPAEFEVASVKIHKPEPGPFRSSTGVEIGRINFTNVTVKQCIRQAYGLKTYQVSGGPGWLADDRYDIVAKAPGPASREELMRMLQALLTERFHLTFHFEAKEMPVYSLVIARKGLKIHPVKDDGGGVQMGGDGAHPFSARNLSMAGFAGTLATIRAVDLPVVDRTGLEGVFNFNLDFAADDAASDSGPSIFTALEEQLGLKLEPSKSSVQILIVDRAEKPYPN